MGKQIKIVVGANFGDEGKGLMTDYFCNELSANASVLNIRHNGGAQAGHTVVTPDGKRHVFSHFGAGSFNPRVATYLSEDFILNPILFCKELDELKKKFDLTPQVYIHPSCRITTPYDMLINQIIENARGDDRHGSCGVGINETVIRYQSFTPNYSLETPGCILEGIRKQYVPERLRELGITSLTTKDYEHMYSDAILYNWIAQFQTMFRYCQLADDGVLALYDHLVFEGAQGLLLDNDYEAFAPHLTPSKTGSYNPKNILLASGYQDADIEVCYVTRTYFTRHGNGLFPSECDKAKLGIDADDQTNHTNEFQGVFRYGRFDGEIFNSVVASDMEYLSKEFSRTRYAIAITHADEVPPDDALNSRLPTCIQYASYGETRNSVQNLRPAS